tara:strand:+ start:206 stop:928 length:723 start_codon:yes stop_codon:yes gene_type:complete
MNLPDEYESEIVVIPTETSSTSNLSSLGGLASFAGVSMSKGPNQTQIALAVLNSRSFLVNFIYKYKLQNDLLAGLWNQETNEWVEFISEEDIANSLRDILSFKSSQDIYYMSINWIDPSLASSWANLLIRELNSHMQALAIKEYEENIRFLKDQLAENSVKEIESVLFKQVEEQTKNIMMANVKKEYVFKVLDPAITPIKPSSPKRLQITILGLILGALFSCIFVITYSYFFKNSRIIKT